MNQTVETELQRALAAYREQESEVEHQATTIAELRRQMSEINAEIDATKIALANVPNPPELTTYQFVLNHGFRAFQQISCNGKSSS